VAEFCSRPLLLLPVWHRLVLAMNVILMHGAYKVAATRKAVISTSISRRDVFMEFAASGRRRMSPCFLSKS